MAGQLHGGNRYGQKVILDFSVNTNPLGLPDYIGRTLEQAVRGDRGLWEWYPDPACVQLRKALGAYHQVPTEQIVCGNGASELIFAVARMFAADGPVTAVLPGPSFSEYERALFAIGAKIRYDRLRDAEDFLLTDRILEQLKADVDLLFLCNPNNPTGSLIEPGLLEKILAVCAQKGIAVVLDECFRELAERDCLSKEESAARGFAGGVASGDYGGLRADAYPHLILLKAFTKLYAMPGLRLGYCICGDREAARRLQAQLPCWNVSNMAQLAGLTALDPQKNPDYISQSRELIWAERRFLTEGLRRLGLRVLPGHANFLCFYCEDSRVETGTFSPGVQPLYEILLAQGILIRDCAGFEGLGPGWYRIAVKTRQENRRLLDELKKRIRG